MPPTRLRDMLSRWWRLPVDTKKDFLMKKEHGIFMALVPKPRISSISFVQLILAGQNNGLKDKGKRFCEAL
ncbi:MAG: hypothetical protein JEY71_15870 [Sphaerochaeta sp.]|nr:hypothetical protein [Sphaerochaeta sp.]